MGGTIAEGPCCDMFRSELRTARCLADVALVSLSVLQAAEADAKSAWCEAEAAAAMAAAVASVVDTSPVVGAGKRGKRKVRYGYSCCLPCSPS